MIAVVVPTVRPEQLKLFKEAWKEQFDRHNVTLFVVHDGENPTVEVNGNIFTVKDVMGEYSDLIYNNNDGVRNLGFALAYKMGADYIVSLDDDVRPFGDTIGDHVAVLNSKKPISYMNTVEDIYMRGFPYWAREEADVVFSHGLWHGVYDFDASTQLLLGTPQPRHIKQPIPKGVLIPVCVMNVMFKAKVLPYYYQAPMGIGVLKELGLHMDRFADIMSGIEVKKEIDKNNWSMVSGYAKVKHERASNPFVNLIKEAYALGVFENYEKSDFRKFYLNKIKKWQKFLKQYDNNDRTKLKT